MSTLADKKGLTFRVEIAPELPSELYGDTNRLQQVIINLAGNAIKFPKRELLNKQPVFFYFPPLIER